jgi:hypothetical protein
VSIKINRTEPKNPPTIVINSLDAKLFLYNCIDAVTRIIKVMESTNEEFVDTAIQTKNNDYCYYYYFKNK